MAQRAHGVAAHGVAAYGAAHACNGAWGGRCSSMRQHGGGAAPCEIDAVQEDQQQLSRLWQREHRSGRHAAQLLQQLADAVRGVESLRGAQRRWWAAGWRAMRV